MINDEVAKPQNKKTAIKQDNGQMANETARIRQKSCPISPTFHVRMNIEIEKEYDER